MQFLETSTIFKFSMKPHPLTGFHPVFFVVADGVTSYVCGRFPWRSSCSQNSIQRPWQNWTPGVAIVIWWRPPWRSEHIRVSSLHLPFLHVTTSSNPNGKLDWNVIPTRDEFFLTLESIVMSWYEYHIAGVHSNLFLAINSAWNKPVHHTGTFVPEFHTSTYQYIWWAG
jgi:hypothetical protein